MGKIYTACPEHVYTRITEISKAFHSGLIDNKVKIEALFVSKDEDADPEKPALALNGYACLAVIRITSLKERSAGRGDAEITFDCDRYEELTDAQRDALIDHELTHLRLKTNRYGQVRDAAHRPKLTMRKHDHQFGWFDDVARRHGESSGEVRQARDLLRSAEGQLYFGFVREVAA